MVWCNACVLRLRDRHLTLRFDIGVPLALAAPAACARSSWDEWEHQHQESASEGENQ